MKKYALSNSYFKNRQPNDPDTPAEVVSYLREHGELPFRYDGDNWPYDMVCERQKRRGVIRCQHLTPDATAARMAELARMYKNDVFAALEPACGTGQITKQLLEQGFVVSAFDVDPEMIAVHNHVHPDVHASVQDFRDIKDDYRWQLIVSNPPFDREIALDFMQWMVENLATGGRAVLLLPKNYVDKTSPKALKSCLDRLKVIHRCDVREKFAHASTPCEIVVLEKTA